MSGLRRSTTLKYSTRNEETNLGSTTAHRIQNRERCARDTERKVELDKRPCWLASQNAFFILHVLRSANKKGSFFFLVCDQNISTKIYPDVLRRGLGVRGSQYFGKSESALLRHFPTLL